MLLVDKLYITHSEWQNEYGGAKAKKKKEEENPFCILPHNYCSLTLAPFVTPVCSTSGHIFDLLPIMDYLDAKARNPVTGEPLGKADLIKLEYSRNAAGEFYCPVTLKTFNDHSHIVAVASTGQVYSADGLAQLKHGERSYRDFFTDKEFTKDDLITLQDPKKLASRNMNEFQHVRDTMGRSTTKKWEAKAQRGGATGTSTIAMDSRHLEKKDETAETKLFRSIKIPGKATIRTSLGDLHLELFCHKAPKTCYNFIALARRGHYVGVTFHRLIAGFVVQGGDPSGTGVGGNSCWGGAFENEIYPGLTHNTRGILSMANRGRDHTNTSQFFITFAKASHLDRIHPVFGRIIGGWDVLEAIEQAPIDESSRPIEPIVIQDVIVTVDPFAEEQNRLAIKEKNRKHKDPLLDPTLVVKRAKSSVHNTMTVGKYIKKSS